MVLQIAAGRVKNPAPPHFTGFLFLENNPIWIKVISSIVSFIQTLTDDV